MARGDAIYARCNVDWPTDPRCVLLPDNNARWLNHLMWLWCTKHRSPELPVHYSLEYMAKAADIEESAVEGALRAMGDRELISVSPSGGIVVTGVTKQNSRLEWKCTEIEGCKNPWKSDPDYLWAIPVTPRSDRYGERVEANAETEAESKGEENPHKSLQDKAIPVTPRNAPIERERERDIERESRCEPPIRGATPSASDESLKDSPTNEPIEFPIKDSTGKWACPQSKVEEWKKTFGDGLNVVAEIIKARQWLLDNPTKQKTARGMPSFLGAWLNRSQNRRTETEPKSIAPEPNRQDDSPNQNASDAEIAKWLGVSEANYVASKRDLE